MGRGGKAVRSQAIALACADPWGRPISLTKARWVGHVLDHHAELAPHLYAVEVTLTRPERVTRDRRHDNRAVYYRAHLLPAPLDHLYLKVVVEFGRGGSDTATAGVVITAYPVPDVTEGEVQLWP